MTPSVHRSTGGSHASALGHDMDPPIARAHRRGRRPGEGLRDVPIRLDGNFLGPIGKSHKERYGRTRGPLGDPTAASGSQTLSWHILSRAR